jgi:hypothetical protein
MRASRDHRPRIRSHQRRRPGGHGATRCWPSCVRPARQGVVADGHVGRCSAQFRAWWLMKGRTGATLVLLAVLGSFALMGATATAGHAQSDPAQQHAERYAPIVMLKR